ncbi:MAG: hypothetical protein ABIA76_03345 [Candidatus Diapherotrites archaeon]
MLSEADFRCESSAKNFDIYIFGLILKVFIIPRRKVKLPSTAKTQRNPVSYFDEYNKTFHPETGKVSGFLDSRLESLARRSFEQD